MAKRTGDPVNLSARPRVSPSDFYSMWSRIDGNTGRDYGERDCGEEKPQRSVPKHERECSAHFVVERNGTVTLLQSTTDLVKQRYDRGIASIQDEVGRQIMKDLQSPSAYNWPDGHGPGVAYLRCVVYRSRLDQGPPLILISSDGRLRSPSVHEPAVWSTQTWVEQKQNHPSIWLDPSEAFCRVPTSLLLLDTHSDRELDQGMPGLVKCDLSEAKDEDIDWNEPSGNPNVLVVLASHTFASYSLLWVKANAVRTCDDLPYYNKNNQ